MTKEEMFKKIPNEWYPIFVKELKKIYPIITLEELFNIESTSGWRVALKKASIIINKEWIVEEWDRLPWYDSDEFDNWIANKVLEDAML